MHYTLLRMEKSMYSGAMPTLSDLVRDARVARGLTQEELDERAGMSPGYTAQLEIGRVVRPKPKTMRKLAAALGLSLEDFGIATGQLDTPRADVVAAMEQIGRLSTEAERLEVFRSLPLPVQRSIRRLATDFLSAAMQGLQESNGSPVDQR